MIVIVDYGMGNLGSIFNMLRRVGCENMEISSDEKKILTSEKLILPGVGNFTQAMTNLNKLDLISVLHHKVIKEKVPIMGICLGMQLLFNTSEEGNCRGLGWVQGHVAKFDSKKSGSNFKIPHMGWNKINIKKNDPMIKNLSEESKFYFVHSYHAICKDRRDVLMTTDYMHDFHSGIASNNIYGFQFHPEKSHKYGYQIFKNFIKI